MLLRYERAIGFFLLPIVQRWKLVGDKDKRIILPQEFQSKIK